MQLDCEFIKCMCLEASGITMASVLVPIHVRRSMLVPRIIHSPAIRLRLKLLPPYYQRTYTSSSFLLANDSGFRFSIQIQI